LEALRDFTLAMVRQRGELEAGQLEAFYSAGYTQQNVLEVILGLSQKVMSNYTNHIAQTPVDNAFQVFAWQKK
jgi:alkylhydroperoxidase family enzyme